MGTWEHKAHVDMRSWEYKGHEDMGILEHEDMGTLGNEDIRTLGYEDMRTHGHEYIHEKMGTMGKLYPIHIPICTYLVDCRIAKKMATLNSLSNTTQYGICWWTLKALWFILVG